MTFILLPNCIIDRIINSIDQFKILTQWISMLCEITSAPKLAKCIDTQHAFHKNCKNARITSMGIMLMDKYGGFFFCYLRCFQILP